MPWQIQPLIWVLVIGTLAFLAIPRSAHPEEPSLAIRRACSADVKRLCPTEFAARDSAAIGVCMKNNATSISARCMAAWIREHGLSK